MLGTLRGGRTRWGQREAVRMSSHLHALINLVRDPIWRGESLASSRWGDTQVTQAQVTPLKGN